MAGISILRRLLMKEAMKKNAPFQHEGIMSISKALATNVDSKVKKMVESAKRQGIDFDQYNEEQVKYILELNKPKSPNVIPADSPEGKLFTQGLMDALDKDLGKNVIKADFGEPFAEQAKKFKGPVQTTEDMGELGKVNVDIDYSASLDKPEFFGADAKNMFGEPVKTGSEYFKDMKKFHLNQINRKKKEMVPPTHPNYKLLKKSLQDQEDSLVAAQITEELGGNQNMYDFLRSKQISDPNAKPLKKSDYVKKDDPEDMATGGRVGLFFGTTPKIAKGLSELRQLLKFFGKSSDKVKKPSDILAISNPKRLNKFSEKVMGKVSKEGIMATDLLTDYQTQMSKDRIKTVKEMLESAKNIRQSEVQQARLTNEMIEEMMSKGADRETAESLANALSNLAENVAGKQSGVPKLTDEGILQLENVVKNLETGGKTARELNASGGRIGLKEGMSRRKFLQIMGGLGSIPILGKFLKFGKAAKSVKAAPIVTTPPVKGKPAWFDSLVNKVIAEGEDVTKKFATKDREIVHVKALDDETTIYVHRDLDEGTVRVDIDDPVRNVKGEQEDALVSLEFKPGKADETTKGKPPDTFTAVEHDYANYADGPDDYVTETIENSVTDTKDLTSDLTKVKLYAKGQEKPTMKEFIESKKRREQVQYAEEQPSQYAADRGPEFPEYDDYASGGIAGMLGE